jgi:hypothetical protein
MKFTASTGSHSSALQSLSFVRHAITVLPGVMCTALLLLVPATAFASDKVIESVPGPSNFEGPTSVDAYGGVVVWSQAGPGGYRLVEYRDGELHVLPIPARRHRSMPTSVPTSTATPWPSTRVAQRRRRRSHRGGMDVISTSTTSPQDASGQSGALTARSTRLTPRSGRDESPSYAKGGVSRFSGKGSRRRCDTSQHYGRSHQGRDPGWIAAGNR